MNIFKKIIIILAAILALEIAAIYLGYKNNPTNLIVNNSTIVSVYQ